MQKILPFAILASVLAFSACDRGSDLERAAIGAVIGCAAGEVLQNGKCVEGAVVGGAAGALANDI